MKNENLNNTELQNYPDILTVSQMQEYLQIGRSAAYSLIRNGDVNFLKIGKSIRIPKRCLMDFVDRICYNQDVIKDGLPAQKEVIV